MSASSISVTPNLSTLRLERNNDPEILSPLHSIFTKKNVFFQQFSLHPAANSAAVQVFEDLIDVLPSIAKPQRIGAYYTQTTGVDGGEEPQNIRNSLFFGGWRCGGALFIFHDSEVSMMVDNYK